MMTARRTGVLLLLFLFKLMVLGQAASVPHLIRFSGQFVEARGQQQSITTSVTFALYKEESGGTPLWIETQNVHVDQNGRYSVILGAEHAAGLPPELFSNGEPRWIGVQREGMPEAARVQFVSAPYAMKAEDAQSLNGHPASDFLLASQMEKWQSLLVTPSTAAAVSSATTGPQGVEGNGVNTGTANALAKYVDGSSVGTSAMVEVNGRLGIGTQNPQAAVHLAAALPRAFIQATTPGNNAGLWFESRPSDLTVAAKRGGVYFSAGSTAQSTFVGFTADDLNYQLMANQSGDIGVGTTLPAGRLHVVAPIARSILQGTSAGKLAEFRIGGLSQTSVPHWGALYFQPGDTPSSSFVAMSGDDSTFHLVVNSAGDVGVGTTTPAAKLDVGGNIRLSNGGALVFSDGTSQTTAAAGEIRATDTSVMISTASSIANVSVADHGITTAKLADGAVNSSKLAVAAVGTSNLADASVSGAKIANGAVTNTHLADGVITSNKLAALSVVSAAVADGAITTTKLAAASIGTAQLADGAVTGLKLADGSVTGAKLQPNTVSSGQIADGSITGTKVAAVAIGTNHLADGAVTLSKLASGAVTSVAIADGSITGNKLAAGSVSSGHILDGAISTLKLADGSITAAKLQPGIVDGTIISDGSITTTKLANGSVTSAKLSGTIPATAITGTAATLGPNSFLGNQGISGTVAVTTTGVASALTSNNSSPTDATVYARNSAATGTANGIRAESASTGGIALYSYGSGGSGFTRAVQGRVDSVDGTALEGIAYASTGVTSAIHGLAYSGQAKVIVADATSSVGTTYGVYAQTYGDNGSSAVYGSANNTTATATYGVYGRSSSTLGIGVLGYNTAISGSTTGVYGRADSSSGTAAEFDNSVGGTILTLRSREIKVARVDGTGKLYANGGTQVGGADFAESVKVRGPRAIYAPGDVLIVDPDHDRRFLLSNQPYQTTVAGIFSTKPGVLGTPHAMDSPEFAEEVPLAMVGIVPCKASTENGVIRRGDLLVTSSTAGYVMKGTDRNRMLGAVVGKALQPLDSGMGLIECMVTLQ